MKCEGLRASLNPIAGTIRPGEGDAEQLLASEKDRAEHVMLVDLGRNDLSRVCRAGTVHVERFMEPERFSHVTHLVSEVVGELREEANPFDLLRACFPAGTVSGAPKVRAMQIISELEGYRRGVYAGAVGYALPGGTLDTCIAIRTLVLRDGVAMLQAGGGIVADSDPTRRASGVPQQARCARGRDRAGGGARDDRQSRILLVDNYDSFTYNLAHLFEELGAEVVVIRNDVLDADDAEALAPTHLVISPGPGRPADAGASSRSSAAWRPRIPTLGVCLGHQAIVEAFGGEVGPGEAPRPRQGEQRHARRQAGSSQGLAEPPRGRAAITRSRRRWSRTCSRSPRRTDDGEVMAVRHREYSVDGIQFHPESVLTPLGPEIGKRFLEAAAR